MTNFILLLLAGICLGIYFWNGSHQKPATGNRYRKKKPAPRNTEGRVVSKPTAKTEEILDEAYEDVLGLQPQKQTPPKKAAQSNNPLRHDRIIVLYLMSQENVPFSGYELLQALLSAGLRYGDQQIFHRHTHKDGRGDILFHCASAMAPGTFDLTHMGSTHCKGLSFFFSTADVEDPLFAFNCLLETLDQLVEDLGGTVLDDQHALLTTQKMLAYREQLHSVEESHV